MRTASLILLLLAAQPAAAEDNPACARYQEPLAYNACLARQGPAARAVHLGGVPPSAAHTSDARPGRAAGRIANTMRRGRSEMVFSVRK